MQIFRYRASSLPFSFSLAIYTWAVISGDNSWIYGSLKRYSKSPPLDFAYFRLISRYSIVLFDKFIFLHFYMSVFFTHIN